MADTGFVVSKLIGILTGPAVRKIDFRVGPIHVDPVGFSEVCSALINGAVSVRIGGVPAGVEAAYSSADDEYLTPRVNYGVNVEEEMALAHESCHALIDYRKYSGVLRVHGEVAAYLVSVLYYRYRSGGSLTGVHGGALYPHFTAADSVAAWLMGHPGASIPVADINRIAGAVLHHPVYGKVTSVMALKADGVF